MKMTVARRITLTMVAVSALVLIGGLLGIWSVQKTGNATDDILEKSVPLADNSMEMVLDLLAQADTLAEYGLQVDPAKLPALEKEFNLHAEAQKEHEVEIDKYIQFAVYGKEDLKKIHDEEDKNDEVFAANTKAYMEHVRKLLEYRARIPKVCTLRAKSGSN